MPFQFALSQRREAVYIGLSICHVMLVVRWSEPSPSWSILQDGSIWEQAPGWKVRSMIDLEIPRQKV